MWYGRCGKWCIGVEVENVYVVLGEVLASCWLVNEVCCDRQGAVTIDDQRGRRSCGSRDCGVEKPLNKEMDDLRPGFDVHLNAGSQTFCITLLAPKER